MADSNAISAQGTLIYRQGVAVAELRDITGPALTRNPIETTMHNSDDSSFVVGIRRKGELQFELGFLPLDEVTHSTVSGLMKAWTDGTKNLWQVHFPDGADWYFSGYITNISPAMPVDDGLTASVTIQPTGGHIFAGV